MPPSQLKRLKASLRIAGVTGQQKAKNKRKLGSGSSDSRLGRNEALSNIREEFNPFEIKRTKEKHVISGQGKVKGREGHPGLSKQIGEEHRKRTLLVEMQKRNKAGGIVDRRFGENDPTMAPEDRMLERFTREKQKRVRGGEIFNLEDDEELTHFGESLGGLQDQFTGSVGVSENADENSIYLARKRQLDSDSEDGSDTEKQSPERKKSKAEVMKEIISKSKLHKYERQKAKDEDENEREKLDAEMGELWSSLDAKQPYNTGKSTGANNEPLGGGDSTKNPLNDGILKTTRTEDTDQQKEKAYDQAVKEMMFDKRSKPAERSKTEEEKVAEEGQRLKKLEEQRQRRMDGEEDSGDEHSAGPVLDNDEEEIDEATAYGFGEGIPQIAPRVIFGDNPDALLEGDYEVSDDGYVDMDGEGIVNISDDYDLEHSLSPPENEAPDKDEDDFLANLLPSTETDNKGKDSKTSSQLAFTFSCPITHQEMLQLMKDIPVQDTPTVVQRIRILYHPKLAAENKTKLQNFAPVLLEHIIYLANLRVIKIPFLVIDTLVRHLHALAKSFPEIAAKSYRCHLKEIHESRINGDLRPGDLVMLTTIATIFPTSDQFHPVVTPAMVIMCKWLGQVVPNSIGIMAMGSYVITLCIQYQTLSQRYVPELVGYILRGILQLIPIGTQTIPGYFPYEETDVFRIQNVPSDWEPRKLSFSDIFDPSEDTPFAVLQSFFALLNQLFQLWAAKNSFLEIFEPVEKGLSHLLTKECRGKFGPVLKNQLLSLSNELSSKLSKARPLRRPLELHHHRPLPIPSNIPKFEEDYNMDKRYDPNVERRELTKLKAEHKREKKGAVREIRKDSRFISRVKLAEDKETSKAYHAKMARLTAMIQSEEGAAANEYKRQKASRR